MSKIDYQTENQAYKDNDAIHSNRWELEQSKSQKIDHIMNIVDALVDKECALVRARNNAEKSGNELLDIWEKDKINAIVITKRRIWDALEKL